MQNEEYKPEAAKQYANRHNRFENDVCSVEYILTTPAIIEKLLDGNLRNRRLNAGHMKKLSIDIKNGKYVFNGQPIIRDANGYLRDGQHRLIALKEAGYPPVPILLVTLKGDLSHIEQAYDRMDINKSRTYSQRLEHKGLDHAKTIAALRKKKTYIKTNFNSFPIRCMMKSVRCMPMRLRRLPRSSIAVSQPIWVRQYALLQRLRVFSKTVFRWLRKRKQERCSRYLHLSIR